MKKLSAIILLIFNLGFIALACFFLFQIFPQFEESQSFSEDKVAGIIENLKHEESTEALRVEAIEATEAAASAISTIEFDLQLLFGLSLILLFVSAVNFIYLTFCLKKKKPNQMLKRTE